IGVFHLRKEVEVLAIPEEFGAGPGPGGAASRPEPGQIEVVDRLGVLPGGVVAAAVDGGRRLGPAALEGATGSLGGRGRGRRRRFAATRERQERGQGRDSSEWIHGYLTLR